MQNLSFSTVLHVLMMVQCLLVFKCFEISGGARQRLQAQAEGAGL